MQKQTGLWVVIGLLAVLGLAIGLLPSEQPKADQRDRFPGRQLRLAVTQGNPLTQTFRRRLPEWAGRTEAEAAVDERPAPDMTADLLLVRGDELAALGELEALPDALLDDKDFFFLQIATRNRRTFARQDGETVAMPIAGDRLALWYRSDLFQDEAIKNAFLAAHQRPLVVPQTWEEYTLVAEFFAARPEVEFGCVEPCVGAAPVAGPALAEQLRPLMARAAAYTKTVDRDEFAIDPENARVLVGGAGWVRAVDDWRRALIASPVAAELGQRGLSEAEACALFCQGKAALALATKPPTLFAGDRTGGPHSGQIQPAPTPGSAFLYAPGAADPTPVRSTAGPAASGSKAAEAAVNRCVHLATTGYYLVPGQGKAADPAVGHLILFLCSQAETNYLTPAARDGFIPLRPKLLNNPGSFRGYGLPVSTITRFFEDTQSAYEQENWVADLRFPERDDFHRDLQAAVRAGWAKPAETAAALGKMAETWQARLDPDRRAFLRRYRLTLGLPPLVLQ